MIHNTLGLIIYIRTGPCSLSYCERLRTFVSFLLGQLLLELLLLFFQSSVLMSLLFILLPPWALWSEREPSAIDLLSMQGAYLDFCHSSDGPPAR